MPAVATKKTNASAKTAPPPSSELKALDIIFSVPEDEHAWGITLLQSTAAVVITYINRHGIPYEDLSGLIDTVKSALAK